MAEQAGGEWEHSYCDGGQPRCRGLGLGVAKEVTVPSFHPRLWPGKLINDNKNNNNNQTIIGPCPEFMREL